MKNNAVQNKLDKVVDSLIAKHQAESDVKKDLAVRQEMELERVKGEIDRIWDAMSDRIRAVLLTLGIETGQIGIHWRPSDDNLEGLAERLSHIEITPEVKANL